jgi:hypothetical protein
MRSRSAQPFFQLLILLGWATFSFSTLSASGVPFELSGHLIIVETSVGSLNSLRFAVDTGATDTFICESIARRLQLEGTNKEVTSFGKRLTFEQVVLPSLRLGNYLMSGPTTAFAGPLSFLADGEIDGLIGVDVLRETALTIDYVNHVLYFGPTDHSRSQIPFYGGSRIIMMPILVNGARAHIRLDTGTGVLLLYRNKVAPPMAAAPTGSHFQVTTMKGKVALTEVSLPEVCLGEYCWPQLTALIQDGEFPGLNIIGNVGPLALGIKRLHLDFPGNLISWETQSDLDHKSASQGERDRVFPTPSFKDDSSF